MKEIMGSVLLAEFVAFLKTTNWPAFREARVAGRRRRLRQLVVKVRAVTDAAARHAVRDGSLAAWLQMLREEALRGQQVLDAACCDAAAVVSSTRRFLSGLRALVLCSAEVDRLTEAVEELERLAGPGGDLDHFIKVLRLNDADGRATAMDFDGRAHQQASDRGSAALPVLGVKRKSSCGGPDVDGGQRKRRALGWAWPQPLHSLATFGGLFAAPRVKPPAPRVVCARKVALAMTRVRRRIGQPTGRRRRCLDRRLSQLSLIGGP